MGQATAQLNIAELSRVLGYPEGGRSSLPQLNAKLSPIRPPQQQQQQQLTEVCNSFDGCNQRRLSMDHMDLLKLTPDAKHSKTKDELEMDGDDTAADIDEGSGKENSNSLNNSGFLDEEEFFDFISRFQSKRMDDQRCSLSVPSLSNR